MALMMQTTAEPTTKAAPTSKGDMSKQAEPENLDPQV
jgi:hypothetical protein